MDFEVTHTIDDLDFGDIDTEKITRNTMRRIAEEMTEMVRVAVVAEDDIKSPASLLSPYEAGDRPQMTQKDAWQVHKVTRDSYTVRPHPNIRQRAVVLNYGYQGRITPTNADYLRFTIDGVPTFRKSVEGPDETGYWEKAIQKMEQSDKPKRIAKDELEEELDESI
jgi:hypothetical protein